MISKRMGEHSRRPSLEARNLSLKLRPHRGVQWKGLDCSHQQVFQASLICSLLFFLPPTISQTSLKHRPNEFHAEHSSLTAACESSRFIHPLFFFIFFFFSFYLFRSRSYFPFFLPLFFLLFSVPAAQITHSDRQHLSVSFFALLSQCLCSPLHFDSLRSFSFFSLSPPAGTFAPRFFILCHNFFLSSCLSPDNHDNEGTTQTAPLLLLLASLLSKHILSHGRETERFSHNRKPEEKRQRNGSRDNT